MPVVVAGTARVALAVAVLGHFGGLVMVVFPVVVSVGNFCGYH